MEVVPSGAAQATRASCFLLQACSSAHICLQMPQEVLEQFRALKLRPDDFAARLQQTGFASVEELREGGHRGFDRPLLLCRKAAPGDT